MGHGVLPLAQLFGSFAWSCVYVSLPFYVKELSPHDPVTTLRWTGWILGITGLVAVPSSALWGWLASRRSPKSLYVGAVAVQSLAFVLLAFATTLPALFLVRLALGVIGGASTLGFIMVGSSASGDVRRGVSAFQAALTAGQVVGPLAGAVAAARVGYGWSFMMAGALLCADAILVARGVPWVAPITPPSRAQTASWREVVGVSLLSLMGSAQIVFLPAILPEVLAGFTIEEGRRLEIGGLVVFASGAAAAVGSFVAPRVADLLGDRAAVRAMVLGSGAGLVLLGVAPTVWWFGAVRVLQVLCIAPLFPLLFAPLARRVQGQVLGLVNSSRIAASFVGPIVATTLLGHTTPLVVYVVMALGPLPCLPYALRHTGGGGAARAGA